MLRRVNIVYCQIIKEYPQRRCKTMDPDPTKPDTTMHDIDTCDQYWQAAVGTDYRISTAHRIKVDSKYCYNRAIYSTKGWCELADDDSKWGVCSPSCDRDFMQV